MQRRKRSRFRAHGLQPFQWRNASFTPEIGSLSPPFLFSDVLDRHSALPRPATRNLISRAPTNPTNFGTGSAAWSSHLVTARMRRTLARMYIYPSFVSPSAVGGNAFRSVGSKRCGKRLRAFQSKTTLCAVVVPPASLSAPFPLGDPFLPGQLVFMQSEFSSSARPELIGAVLWAVGLYLGLSQRQRLGEALRSAMKDGFTRVFPKDIAESAATALHTLPFLFAGFAIDSALRVAAGGNGAWADASGLTLALYGGVYEAGRSSAKTKKVDEAEEKQFNAFVDFAQRRLERRGRCHLYDVRNALVQDSTARGRVGRISDEQLRRFIRNYAPSAIRSPNGYYRELSVVKTKKADTF